MNLSTPALSALQRYVCLALCAGIFVLPMINIGGRALTLAASDLVLPVVLLLAGAQWWAAAPHHDRIRLPAATALVPFAAWFAWVAFSALWGVRFHLANVDPYILKKLVGFVVLGLYAGAGCLVATRLPYDRILWVLVGSAVAGSIVGYLRLFMLPLDLRYASLPYGYRLLGMTHNPNLFGLQQAAILVMCLDWLRRPGSDTGWRWLPPGRDWLLATVLAGLWLSGSRTAIVALAVAVGGGVVVRRVSAVLLARQVALSALIAITAFGVFSGYRAVVEAVTRALPVLSTFLTSFGNVGLLVAAEPQGIGHRAYIHQRAWDIFHQEPWLGIGLGQFYLWFQASGDRRAGEVHNSYLWILTELGIVGMLIALCCIAYVLFRAMHLPGTRAMAAPLCLIIFYATAAFGTEVAFQRPMYFFAGILAVVATAYGTKERPHDSPISLRS